MTTQQLQSFSPFALGQRTARCRVISLIPLVLVALGLPAFSGAQQVCLPNGDVDQNGTVTAADALLAFQQALGLVQLDACQQSTADVYPQPAAPDGNITASDALCIFQKALSLPSCLDTLPSANQPPVADAGPDQFVEAGMIVMLSGTGSDPDGMIASYGWTQTGGTTVMLIGAESVMAAFTAPDVSTDETLTFRFAVTDDADAQAIDDVQVTVRPPPASAEVATDDFSPSVSIIGASGRSRGSNVGAGTERGEPNHAGDSGGASVWWTWTAPATGPVVFNTHGSDFDTLLAIYTGNSLNDLTVVASNDDTDDKTLQSMVRFSAQQGQTYHIAVDGYGGETGTIVLNWQTASVSGNLDVALHLSELTQDTSQGKVIIVEYEGPEFNEDDLSVRVGDVFVESSFVDSQIHFIFPLTESGETLLEFEFGDFSSSLSLDILAAPAIADPPSYISGVVDNIMAELGAFSDGDWGDEIAALYAAEQALSNLSEDEIHEVAVFFKQNLEPLLRLLNSPVVAQDEADCETEIRHFVSIQVLTRVAIAGLILKSFAGPVAALNFLDLAVIVSAVWVMVESTEDILNACLVTRVNVLLGELANASAAPVRSAGPIVAQDDPETIGRMPFEEGQAQAIILSLDRTFDPERRSEFVSAIQDLGNLLSKLNNGLRSVVGILPGFLSGLAGGINSFIGKFDGFISTFAGLENPDRVETANHADFRLAGISDRNITGSITDASSERLFLEFNFVDRSLAPQDGCVDFDFTLSNSQAGLDATVPARLCTDEKPDDDICIQETRVDESDRTGHTVTSKTRRGWSSDLILTCWISITHTDPNYVYTRPPYCPDLHISTPRQSLDSYIRQMTERAAERALLEWAYEHITCPLYITEAHEQCLSGSVPGNARIVLSDACER